MKRAMCKGPVAQRRASEKQAWQVCVSELAAKLPALTPRKYVRHPITGEICELR